MTLADPWYDTIILGRPWYDALTLAFVALFFVIELVLLFRSSRLGWAMTAKCAALSSLFGVALLMPPLERYDPDRNALTVVRIAVVLALGWVIYELARVRRTGAGTEPVATPSAGR